MVVLLFAENAFAEGKTVLENVDLIVGIVVSLLGIIIAYLTYRLSKKKKGKDIVACRGGLSRHIRDWEKLTRQRICNRSQWIDTKEQLLCSWRPKGRVRTPEREIPAYAGMTVMHRNDSNIRCQFRTDNHLFSYATIEVFCELCS